jgi:hypothetical protein
MLPNCDYSTASAAALSGTRQGRWVFGDTEAIRMSDQSTVIDARGGVRIAFWPQRASALLGRSPAHP